MSHPIAWQYGESDPALMLWTAAVSRFGLTWPRPDARVLELGCAETDFLTRLTRQNTGLVVTGVDARAEGGACITAGAFVQGDAARADLFEPESFDVVVMLGALEHFGLGYYGDPINDAGDVQTMANVARWLRPGGWVYFDVPCNPTYSIAA